MDLNAKRKASRPDVPQPLSTTRLSGAPWWRSHNDSFTVFLSPTETDGQAVGQRETFVRPQHTLRMSAMSKVIIVKYAGFSAGLGTFNRFFSVR